MVGVNYAVRLKTVILQMEIVLPLVPRKTTFYESDVPCGTDDGDDSTIEASCTVVEECGETIYCRAKGF